MADTTENLLSPAQLIELVAPILCFTPKRTTLALWRCRGSGPPYIKIGNETFYPAREAREWALSRRSPMVRSGRELKQVRDGSTVEREVSR